jgi:hypothetical protein
MMRLRFGLSGDDGFAAPPPPIVDDASDGWAAGAAGGLVQSVARAVSVGLVAAAVANAQHAPFAMGWSSEPELPIPPAPLTVDEEGPTPFGLGLLRPRAPRYHLRLAAGGTDALAFTPPPIVDDDAGSGIVGSEAIGGIVAAPGAIIVLIPAPGAWSTDELPFVAPPPVLDDGTADAFDPRFGGLVPSRERRRAQSAALWLMDAADPTPIGGSGAVVEDDAGAWVVDMLGAAARAARARAASATSMAGVGGLWLDADPRVVPGTPLIVDEPLELVFGDVSHLIQFLSTDGGAPMSSVRLVQGEVKTIPMQLLGPAPRPGAARTAQSVAGAITVTVTAWNPHTVPIAPIIDDADLAIVDEDLGMLSYRNQPTESAIAGQFTFEARATWPDGTVVKGRGTLLIEPSPTG